MVVRGGAGGGILYASTGARDPLTCVYPVVSSSVEASLCHELKMTDSKIDSVPSVSCQ